MTVIRVITGDSGPPHDHGDDHRVRLQKPAGSLTWNPCRTQLACQCLSDTGKRVTVYLLPATLATRSCNGSNIKSFDNVPST